MARPVFPLLGEPLAVDLANTVMAERNGIAELLTNEQRLGDWLGLHRHALAPEVLSAPPPLESVKALRDAIREVLEAALDGRAPIDAAMEAVNRAIANGPPPGLHWESGRFVQETASADTASGVVGLAALARSALETVTGADAPRLRRCQGNGCVLLFVARHPRRRYCSAEHCGTRTRVARHRHRVLAASA